MDMYILSNFPTPQSAPGSYGFPGTVVFGENQTQPCNSSVADSGNWVTKAISKSVSWVIVYCKYMIGGTGNTYLYYIQYNI